MIQSGGFHCGSAGILPSDARWPRCTEAKLAIVMLSEQFETSKVPANRKIPWSLLELPVNDMMKDGWPPRPVKALYREKHHRHFLSSLAVKTQIRSSSIVLKQRTFSPRFNCSSFAFNYHLSDFQEWSFSLKPVPAKKSLPLFLLCFRSFISSTSCAVAPPTLRLLRSALLFSPRKPPEKRFSAFVSAWEDAAARAASHPRTNMFFCSNLLWQGWHQFAQFATLETSLGFQTHPDPSQCFPQLVSVSASEDIPTVLSSDVQTCCFPSERHARRRSQAKIGLRSNLTLKGGNKR